jgi:hypothetical protein
MCPTERRDGGQFMATDYSSFVLLLRMPNVWEKTFHSRARETPMNLPQVN